MKHHILGRTLSLILFFVLLLSLFGGCGSKSVDLPQEALSAASSEAAPAKAAAPEPNPPPAAEAKASSSSQQASSIAAAPDAQSVTVYVTETGTKYHRSGCQYLAKSCIPIDLSSAKRSYGPCSKCNPPT